MSAGYFDRTGSQGVAPPLPPATRRERGVASGAAELLAMQRVPNSATPRIALLGSLVHLPCGCGPGRGAGPKLGLPNQEIPSIDVATDGYDRVFLEDSSRRARKSRLLRLLRRRWFFASPMGMESTIRMTC